MLQLLFHIVTFLSAEAVVNELYSLEILSGKGNQILKILQGETVADSACNYALSHGFDTDAVVQQVVPKVCQEIGYHNPECDRTEPHELLGMHNVTQMWVDDGLYNEILNRGLNELHMYVRSSYTPEIFADLFCARFICTPRIRIKIVTLAQEDLVPASSSSLRSKFERVYNYEVWGSSEVSMGGGSGMGSSVEGTENTRKFLVEVLRRYDIKSILDAGCGALSWMPHVLLSTHLCSDDSSCPVRIRYTGVDIAQNAVNRATRMANTYNHKNQWQFYRMDITTDSLSSLPIFTNSDLSLDAASTFEASGHTQPVQLIVVRDVFFHLPFERIKCALNQFSRLAIAQRNKLNYSGPVYLLATSNTDAGGYSENNTMLLPMGSYRATNLRENPINLPDPIEVFNDKEMKIMGLWNLPLPLYIFPNGSELMCY